MDFIPKDKILETKPDTLEFIRKQYELDKPGQMEEAINILHEWVQKQNHFKKKDFSRHYYEMSIISSKGSIERAKKNIDRNCTIRTLIPHFFRNYTNKADVGKFNNISHMAFLPKLTQDHYRVKILKINDVVLNPVDCTNFFIYNLMMLEYLKVHDYTNGLIIVVDYSEANLKEILTKVNLLELKQIMNVYIEGYGMRIQGIHLITTSKLIELLIAIFKQVVSPKIMERQYVHKTYEAIHEYIPKSILPKDYGGEERLLKELHEEWLEVISSEEHMQYMKEINGATTDETRRQNDQFHEEHAGLPGTFRVLSVD